MRVAFTILQGGTFVVLGAILLAEGEWRLGVAQWLLAAVTVVVYS